MLTKLEHNNANEYARIRRVEGRLSNRAGFVDDAVVLVLAGTPASTPITALHIVRWMSKRDMRYVGAAADWRECRRVSTSVKGEGEVRRRPREDQGHREDLKG